MTDLLAFGIGASSTLPALASFCGYAAIAIFAVFVYMASFFLALLVIDQRRIDVRRDGCICCWKKSESWTPNECSQKSVMDLVFTSYAKALIKVPTKVIIFVITLGFLGASVYGVANIQSQFDFLDWFPQDSYLIKYFKEQRMYFPSGGIAGKVYIAEVPDLHLKLLKVNELVEAVGNVSDLSGNDVRSFLPEFISFVSTTKSIALGSQDVSETQFREYLKEFLCSPGGGAKWRGDITFVEQLNCTSADSKAPSVKMITFDYTHKE